MSPLDVMRARLNGRPEFDVEGTLREPVAYRRRIIPNRGIARLLFPRAVVTVDGPPEHGRLAVRPDGYAYVSLTIVLGGLVTELVMDRARYPRDYPPWAVVVIAATVAGSLLVDLLWTQRLLARPVA